jgi:hypothetical protein
LADQLHSEPSVSLSLFFRHLISLFSILLPRLFNHLQPYYFAVYLPHNSPARPIQPTLGRIQNQKHLESIRHDCRIDPSKQEEKAQ